MFNENHDIDSGQNAGNDDEWLDLLFPSFGVLLNRLIQRLGWSQSDLANRIETGQSKISEYINDKVKPQRDTCLRIVTVLEQDGRLAARDIDRLKTAYEEYSARVRSPANADERFLRVYDRLRAYPPEVVDHFTDTYFSMARLVEASYQAGYQAGYQDGRRDSVEERAPR